MSEFRGLAHIVEVWRRRSSESEADGSMPADLEDVLRMADEYMTEVEQQQPIDVVSEVAHTDQAELDRIAEQANNHEPGPTCSDECGHDDTSNSDGLPRRTTPMFEGDLSPVGLLPERLCGLPTKHFGHDWSAESTKDVFTYWCNGVAGVPPGV